MLNSVAEFYEEDVQTALGATMALIEPFILIVMAVFVGGVLISLYLPIFSLGAEYSLIEQTFDRRKILAMAKMAEKQTNCRTRRKRRSARCARYPTWTTSPGRRTWRAVIAASSSTCTTSSFNTICSRRSQST